ncbi:MAG: alpha/beta hydrolase [Methylocystis sp.]|uniref:alpha/beta hydrolase n=1 Tax=Methylocystis sp. TaxID=1911079 RepID=UPI003DA39DC4
MTARGSVQARLTAALLRRFVKPRLEGLIRRAQAAQMFFAQHAAQQDAPFGADVAGDRLPAEGGKALATLVYLHGGGFLVGSPRAFRYVSKAFARAGFDVFAPAYRLAPAHVFPAALDDALRAYRAVLDARPGPVVLAGDSAGGGLAVSLMLRARDEGLPLPRAAALFSPWTDLAATGASARENEDKDALFTRRLILTGARAVLGRTSGRNPLASPVYADLAGLPPLLVHAGMDEALRDDAARLVERARAAGVSADIELWPDVPHGWQLLPFLPEARESREKGIAFLRRAVVSAPASDPSRQGS